jgi:hypothetical protein
MSVLSAWSGMSKGSVEIRYLSSFDQVRRGILGSEIEDISSSVAPSDVIQQMFSGDDLDY